jgi:cytochrome c oxidase subunit I
MADKHIHLPSQSYWPIVVAFGLPIVGIGLIYNFVISALGGLIVVAGLFGWAMEPSVADPEDEDPPASDSKELATVG